MKAIRSLAMALNASAAVLFVGGCATSADTPPVTARMSKPVAGTVLTYHRKSSGSFGAYDGPVAWTATTADWQGRQVLASRAPGFGASLHDPASLAMLAVLDGKGSPVASYDPPINYQWPLQVGKVWTSQHTMTVHASGRTMPLSFDWKVEAWEDVTVPAGTFKAYRLRWSNNLGETDTRWISPAAGLDIIKRRVERTAAHPQGAGVLEGELVSRVVPRGQ